MKPNSAVDLGAWLRDLRQTGGKTLREVAAAAAMDEVLAAFCCRREGHPGK